MINRTFAVNKLKFFYFCHLKSNQYGIEYPFCNIAG